MTTVTLNLRLRLRWWAKPVCYLIALYLFLAQAEPSDSFLRRLANRMVVVTVE